MSESGDEPVNESRKREEFLPELRFYHDVIRAELDCQVEVVGSLDMKAAILVALDAGIVALASSWIGTGASKWLAIAALIVIVLGLCASLIAIFPRPLYLYLRIEHSEGTEKAAKGRLWEILEQLLRRILKQSSSGVLKRLSPDVLKWSSSEVLQQLVAHDLHNRSIINKKLNWTKTAVVCSGVGLALLGGAHIVRIAVP